MEKNIIVTIREELFSHAESDFAHFQAKLMPNVEPCRVIGVRTPTLRKMAKNYAKDKQIGIFLADLPHEYFEENNLHAFIISEMRDPARVMRELDAFLPFADNWATCDQLAPKIFSKMPKSDLLDVAKGYIASGRTFTVRYGLGILMKYFLDDNFTPEILELAASACSDEYYVNMMIAWLFATALAKRYDDAVVYLSERRLPVWVHNKTIRKAIESYRVSDARKEYLRTLTIKQDKQDKNDKNDNRIRG